MPCRRIRRRLISGNNRLPCSQSVSQLTSRRGLDPSDRQPPRGSDARHQLYLSLTAAFHQLTSASSSSARLVDLENLVPPCYSAVPLTRSALFKLLVDRSAGDPLERSCSPHANCPVPPQANLRRRFNSLSVNNVIASDENSTHGNVSTAVQYTQRNVKL